MTRPPLPSGSQTARPFAAAWFVTLFAIAWNAIVTFALMPIESFRTSGFKWFFLGASVLLTALVISGWRQRFRGGAMQLALSSAEVPVGVAVTARFETDKRLHADDWQATLKVDAPGRRNNARLVLLRQPVAVTALGDRLLEATLRLPTALQRQMANHPAHQLRGLLTVKSRIASWEFVVPVRRATAQELEASKAELEMLPSSRPRERVAAKRRRSGLVAVTLGIMCLATLLMFWNVFKPLRAVGSGEGYRTTVDTPAFPIEISNWNSNQWGVQARLKAQARFRGGTLEVSLDSLALRKMNACMATERHAYCQVNLASAALILTEDRGDHSRTLARSTTLPLDARLRGYEAWHLEVEPETQLALSTPADTLWTNQVLKLELATDDGGYYYPATDGLVLHRALASAQGLPDPCNSITDRREAFDAGCVAQLQTLLQQPVPRWKAFTESAANLLASWQLWEAERNSLDHLLIDAIKTERYTLIEPLLRAGANPNALEPDNPHKTAVGLAAEFDHVEVLALLVQYGGRTDMSLTSDNGVSWTPLKLASRRNSLATIAWLLQNGTSLHDTDAEGWTALHAAARASALEAIERLVSAGADIDTQTRAWRQETPLMTALRDGSEDTIALLVRLGADTELGDVQGKNACEWARFYRRSDEVKAMVCTE